MKRFADPDSVLLPKRSQNTFLTESQELSVASPGGDSHEPLAVILQPYFLSQPELSLLKICPPVIHLTITSFPVGLVLWDQKKSTCSPKTHSHFSYRSAFSPSSEMTMVPSHQEAKTVHSSQCSYGDCWLSLESQHRIPTKSHHRRLMPTSTEGELPALGVT